MQQARARSLTENPSLIIPLAIMTSEDTHRNILELLQSHSNFGMSAGQITIIKEEYVPEVLSKDCKFQLDPSDEYKVITKPRGDGDIHSLICRINLGEQWIESNKRWVCMIKGMNTLAFRGIPASLGISHKKGFDVNFVTISRKTEETDLARLCKLVRTDTDPDDIVEMTINLPIPTLQNIVLKRSNSSNEHTDADIHSPFPYITNTIIYKLESYNKVLAKTKGCIPEYVSIDPENKDTISLMCNMEDFTKLKLNSAPETDADSLKSLDCSVGFTQMECFVSYSAIKHNTENGLQLLKSGGYAETPSTAESDIYGSNRRILSLCGCDIKTADLPSKTYAGIPIPQGARIILCPSFGTTLEEITKRFPTPQDVTITEASSMVLDGDIVIHKLYLNGDLRIRAAPGAKVVIESLSISNDGVKFIPTTSTNENTDINCEEKYTVRGYYKMNEESLVIDAPNRGVVVVNRPF